MKLKPKTRAALGATAALAIIAAFAAQPSVAQQSATVYMSGKYLNNGQVRVIEVVDQNCNRALGRISLSPGARLPLAICLSSAGYGNIAYRNITNNSGWTGVGFLKNGEEFAPG